LVAVGRGPVLPLVPALPALGRPARRAPGPGLASRRAPGPVAHRMYPAHISRSVGRLLSVAGPRLGVPGRQLGLSAGWPPTTALAGVFIPDRSGRRDRLAPRAKSE